MKKLDDYRDPDLENILNGIDQLMDELDDIVERLEIYYAGLYTFMYLYPDDLE